MKLKVTVHSILMLACVLLSSLFVGCKGSESESVNFNQASQENSEKQYFPDEYGNVDNDNTEISIEDFSPAMDCSTIGCHETHYEEWNRSMHAYSMKDPVFFSGWDSAQVNHPNTGERFCIQCHSPVSFVTGYVPSDHINGPVTAELLQGASNDLVPETIKEGIGCNFCHSITRLSPIISTDNSVTAGTVDDVKYGAQYHLNPGEGIMYGPNHPPAEWNGYHQSEYNYIFNQSGICLPCHNLTIREETVEGTFAEWTDATAQGMGEAESCQSCHMPYLGDHHSHEFAGVDLDLTQDIPEDSQQYISVANLLQNSVELKFGGSSAEDTIKVENSVISIPVTVRSLTQHSLPSGASFAREAWLETIVKDADGDTIFSSGTIEGPTSNLVLSDTLVLYTAYLLGEDGDTVNSVTDAFDILSQMLPAKGILPQGQVRTYEIQRDLNTLNSLSISVRMRFRAFKPFLLEGEHSDLLARQPVFDMARIDTTYIIP